MCPPIPTSISSKIKVGIGSVWARILFNANMRREISPPEAISTNGLSSDPILVATKNSIESIT